MSSFPLQHAQPVNLNMSGPPGNEQQPTWHSSVNSALLTTLGLLHEAGRLSSMLLMGLRLIDPLACSGRLCARIHYGRQPARLSGYLSLPVLHSDELGADGDSAALWAGHDGRRSSQCRHIHTGNALAADCLWEQCSGLTVSCLVRARQEYMRQMALSQSPSWIQRLRLRKFCFKLWRRLRCSSFQGPTLKLTPLQH